MSKTILLIGGHSSGKTHFGAQLYSRLVARSGLLGLRESPTNINLFETTLQNLAEGKSSDHSESGLFGEVILPTADPSGNAVDLVWPDYAGEQVTGEHGISEARAVPARWMDRIARSEYWIFMVRPMFATAEDDLLNRPLHGEPKLGMERKSKFEAKLDISKKPKTTPSAQSQSVELLQVLRHVKRVNTIVPTESPRMLVLLSCWDELPADAAAPEEVLRERLPMLHAFLRANWSSESLLVYGLSSLGKSLSHEKVDPEYQARGPESFGFVVLPDGKQFPDLTLPIADLAN